MHLLVINGSLAGLVGITAGCAFVNTPSAIFIGAVSGLLMMAATNWLEARQIDDPVGAFPVHAASGIWGTLAVGLVFYRRRCVYRRRLDVTWRSTSWVNRSMRLGICYDVDRVKGYFLGGSASIYGRRRRSGLRYQLPRYHGSSSSS